MTEKLANRMRNIAESFQDHLAHMPALRELALTPFQARLLRVIGQRPGVSQLELARRTQRDKAQVARAIKELDTRGLVERRAHPDDWRSQCLFLTPSASTAREKVEDQRREVAAIAFSSLDEAEQDQLMTLLGRIESTLATHPGLFANAQAEVPPAQPDES
ncbi:MarR family winged helix-turn-helix transcriptional regulator [Novosphingobium mangrovi (ex Hu et al. 2023)]|uniref:MarR family winged helix-turn-helix transcriptional regulator n=1 Tax=Novosphingobium mangrovi (ex Hu et al. 2023) TaxID=2930094 RepID=A0ABT0AB93_9SPHN|nr:MarR family winged helix-turn-helix transcriptional regulator [Novosphingobium mangrovi (ex Hu et al. 2023)]MCJ1960475.1 MarR family winged helix-turn-helix transcriptional regulator [Novosphingobium mangrovi (ex Hu et al. 2023)]